MTPSSRSGRLRLCSRVRQECGAEAALQRHQGSEGKLLVNEVVGDPDEIHMRDVQGVVGEDRLSVPSFGLSVPESVAHARNAAEDDPYWC